LEKNNVEDKMAIDVTTIILTSVCTGIGISIGSGLYELYLKDYLKKMKIQNNRLKKINEARLKKLHSKLFTYKRPWIALLLNLFLWGTGYFYVKRKRLLGALLLIIQIFVIGGYAFGQGSWQSIFEGVSYSFLTILLGMYLGLDAYRLARNANAGKE
jgi:hypothetical protein